MEVKRIHSPGIRSLLSKRGRTSPCHVITGDDWAWRRHGDRKRARRRLPAEVGWVGIVPLDCGLYGPRGNHP